MASDGAIHSAHEFTMQTFLSMEGIFSGDVRVAVIGCGHAGLPVAVALSKAGVAVDGFDTSIQRIRALRSGCDDHISAEDLGGIHFIHEPRGLQEARCFIIVVPTPADRSTGEPDLSILLAATEQVGRVLKHGDAVVFESTVYPGCTEEECAPVLEFASGLRRGTGFHLCYAPERINPGDKTYGQHNIVRVVSGCDEASLAFAATLYGRITPAGTHRAPSLRVAEAAKLTENVSIAARTLKSHVPRTQKASLGLTRTPPKFPSAPPTGLQTKLKIMTWQRRCSDR